MRIHNDLEEFQAVNPVVTIGTFDGVHRGHQKVIERLNEIAGKIMGESVLFTFSPHPRLIVSSAETNLRLLNTPEEKRELLEKTGINHMISFPFTKEFSQFTYADFVEKILIGKIKTKCLVVGYDHKFGKNREGDYEFLSKCAAKFNFRLEKLDALLVDNEHISSSRIRAALQAGEIRKANEMLGYEFTLQGTVIEGRRLGHRIGFPTANIEASNIHKLIPGYGVYAVKIEIGGRIFKGMMNIGTRPTFNHNADHRSIEVHIFEFDRNIYGENVALFFVDKIRDEHKFPGSEALVQQLHNDKEIALSILKN